MERRELPFLLAAPFVLALTWYNVNPGLGTKRGLDGQSFYRRHLRAFVSGYIILITFAFFMVLTYKNLLLPFAPPGSLGKFAVPLTLFIGAGFIARSTLEISRGLMEVHTWLQLSMVFSSVLAIAIVLPAACVGVVKLGVLPAAKSGACCTIVWMVMCSGVAALAYNINAAKKALDGGLASIVLAMLLVVATAGVLWVAPMIESARLYPTVDAFYPVVVPRGTEDDPTRAT